MYGCHRLGGASLLVLGGAFCVIPAMARAQTAGQTLPPVTVDAPREARARPAAQKPKPRVSAVRRPATRQIVAMPPSTVSTGSQNITASAARATLYQAPPGQTETTIDRSQFDNRPAFSIGDVLRDSPGISVKQGNGPRDVGISIRGSNARNGFGIRNIVIFEDGFP
jgi:iron complex outermembrane recepter protein